MHLMFRTGRVALVTWTGACVGRAGYGAVAPWPRVSLLLGLLPAMLAGPVHGFDHRQQAQDAAEEFVLDSSGVPTSANWVVLDASGIAAWRARGETQWRRFIRGEVLPPGCEIETGSDGQITLVAGGDQLIVAPQGRLLVPQARPGQDRRLLHERGRILVQIESRAARDVRVDTPLLSLGIKGTTFEVLVDPEHNSVLVHEGDVAVTTSGQPDPTDLGAGQGLRQPAAPGSEAVPFAVPLSEQGGESADGPPWHLPTATTADPAEPVTLAPAVPAGSTEVRPPAGMPRGDSAPARPASSDVGIDFGQLDELASSWGFTALAAVALLILTIPVLALVQHLREQWLARPEPKGQRRRHLVRG